MEVDLAPGRVAEGRGHGGHGGREPTVGGPGSRPARGLRAQH